MRPRTYSARELRRQEKRLLNRKPSRERAVIPPPMTIKMMYVLDPLERIIDDIERTGTVEVANGQPIFRHLEKSGSVAYPAAPAIDGIADFFEMFCTRRGSSMELAGIRQFAKKLEYGMQLTQQNLDAARADMQRMRGLVPLLTQEEADSLILQVQIKSEMEISYGHAQNFPEQI